MSTSRSLVWIASGLLGLAGAACGGDDPDSWPEDRPRIDRVVFTGQSPRDSLALQFAVEFADGDGDTGGGTLELVVDGREGGEIALEELFAAQRPALALDARQGEFEVLVRLQSAPDPGGTITIGFAIVDAAGRRSNEPSVTLSTQ